MTFAMYVVYYAVSRIFCCVLCWSGAHCGQWKQCGKIQLAWKGGPTRGYRKLFSLSANHQHVFLELLAKPSNNKYDDSNVAEKARLLISLCLLVKDRIIF